jgi:hypothetical protein
MVKGEGDGTTSPALRAKNLALRKAQQNIRPDNWGGFSFSWHTRLSCRATLLMLKSSVHVEPEKIGENLMAVSVQNTKAVTIQRLKDAIRFKSGVEVSIGRNKSYFFYPDHNTDPKKLKVTENEPLWVYGLIRNKKKSQESERRATIQIVALGMRSTQSCELIIHED